MSKYKNIAVIFIFFILGVTFLGWVVTHLETESEIKAKKGYLDFSNVNFDKEQTLKLDGEWQFFYQQLIHNQYIPQDTTKYQFVSLPNEWNNAIYKGKKLSPYEYGTYVLRVKFPENLKKVAIKIPFLHSSYSLYADGVLVAQMGKVGTNQENTISACESKIAYCDLAKPEVQLILQVANFSYTRGGVWASLNVGTVEEINVLQKKQLAFDLFTTGGLWVMALYHFVLFFLRRRNISPLYFAVLCLMIGLKNLLAGEVFFSILFPNIHYELVMKIIHICVSGGSVIFVTFLYSLYPNLLPKRFMQTYWLLGLIIFVIIIFTKVTFYGNIIFIIILTSAFFIFHNTFKLFIFALQGKEGATAFVVGFLLVAFTFVHDIFIDLQIISSHLYLIHWGLFTFSLMQSFVLAFKFTGLFKKTEDLTNELTYINKNLEGLVDERTIELKEANEAVLQINEEVKAINDELYHSNKQLLSSIRYASRIQRAVLDEPASIIQQFRDAFILYLPKDVVSGDFYWFSKKEKLKILVAADCTGHGVPGAFMTVMGNSLLNQIVNEDLITNPADILLELDRQVINTKKAGKEQVNDGMDMAIVTYNEENHKLQFSGAKNPIYYVRNQEIFQIKGSKFPIGSTQFHTEKIFEQHTIDVFPDDKFYIFSDGFKDQFSQKGQKYMAGKFRNLLLSISDLPMSEQKEVLHDNLIQWKGYAEQTDDILVIGVQF
jgi:serine phosphatase RsbU (regulator of sigma subunit)